MTSLNSVVLTGVFKNQPVVARFDRFKRRDSARSIGWTLSISIGGKCHRYAIKDKSLKPCWTVATYYMDAPARASRMREAKAVAVARQVAQPSTGGLKVFA